jgi:hypothetical protein
LLALQSKPATHDPTNPAWLFPEVQRATKSPGTTFGSYIKAVMQDGAAKYKNYMAKLEDGSALPLDANASGLRTGACNMLAIHMPLEFCVATTGHHMQRHCAFYEYLDSTFATCLAGAVVLAGWPAFPFGQLGVGPCPPTLEALSTLGVLGDGLDNAILKFFHIDDCSPPQFKKTGKLWPVTHIMFACEVCY